MNKNYADIPCETIVTSITNATRMERIFSEYHPDYVFHAAAYKHVPMMEDNPSEAVQNNVYGTRVIADMAVKYGTKKFAAQNLIGIALLLLYTPGQHAYR